MTFQATWTDEEKDRLCALLAQGLTARVCAEHFPDRSRNSIIGLITRNPYLQRIRAVGWALMGKVLPGPAKKAKNLAKKKALGRSSLARSFVPSLSAKQPPSMPVIEITSEEYDAASRHIRLMELQSGDCRYVVSDRGEQALFCAAPVHPGLSWCEHHNARVFKPVPARRR